MNRKDIAVKLAIAGFQIGAIKFRSEDPFTWASGWKSPMYNDNRMFLKHYDNRLLIIKGFVKMVKEFNLHPDIVAGTATAGIPHSTALANKLGLGNIYIRDKPKEHGMRNRIEGIGAEEDLEGEEILLIEDLVSTGGSSVSAVQAIRDANGDCNYCFSIFSYGFPEADAIFNGEAPFNKEGAVLKEPCKLFPLLSFPLLLEVGIERGFVKKEQQDMLAAWSANPQKWSNDWKAAHVEEKV